MKKKEDRRVQYSKMILQDTLLDLLRNKKLNEISVSELCRKAEVNRNTFYNHYSSPFEILHEIENTLFQELRKEVKNDKELKSIILASCKCLENNKKISELIFSNIENSKLLTKIINTYKTKSIENYPQKAKPFAQLTYIFQEKGTIYLMQEWIKGGFKQPAEQIADYITFLLESNFQSFELYLKKMKQE